MDTDKSFCSIVFDVMIAKGVKEVVCSPGSRNAPLLIAAAARPELRKHVVIDERSAAFMALGLAMVTQRPVALVCTSGTALLNYAPAIAEAFYQGIPLIVISADRPEQWIDQDDSQTLRQFEAFSNYVKRSYQLPATSDPDQEMLWYANRIANDALIEALSRRKGPVHINIQLGEPLCRREPRCTEQPRVIDFIGDDSIGNKEVVRKMAAVIAGRPVFFVAGFMLPDSRLHTAVADFCRQSPNVVAMTETLSNLHLDYGSTLIDSVLTAFPTERLDRMAPALVISIGGSLVSRKLKEYLRRNASRCEHWALGWSHTTSDCFMSLTKRIEADPARLLRQITSALRKIPTDFNDYASEWAAMRMEAKKRLYNITDDSGWSELGVHSILYSLLPSSCNLFLSNGTSIRYAQLFGEKTPHASYCNRGVSGIDGSVSTAIGGAKGYKGLTVMVTGDMSMAYDLNSLALPDIPDTMRIIVIDNRGGGIFRFIPSTSSLKEREQYFCAPPLLPLPHLAAGYGWEYYEAESFDTLTESLPKLFKSKKKGILRIITPPEESAAALKRLLTQQN